MAAEEVTLKRYRCVCGLPGCPGKGRPWISFEDKIPERCSWCKRRTWNHSEKSPKTIALPQVKPSQKRTKVAIALPKPKKVRSTE